MAEYKEILLGAKHTRSRKHGLLFRRIRFWSIAGLIVLFITMSTRWMENERKIKQAQIDISRITHAVRLFRADFGRCPQNVDELSLPPAGSPYLAPVTDPWGRNYELKCPSRRDTEDVDVISRGPDERVSRDNIENLVVEMNL